MSASVTWVEGYGRYPSKSACGLYWIERLASPARTWVAYFRAAIGHMQCVSDDPRESIEAAQADAVAHRASLEAA